MRSVSGAPFLLRVARNLQRSHVRGASFLMRRLKGLGMLNVIAQYQVGDVKFSVPLN